MDLEQWKALQPRVVEVQRLALVFFELGHSDVSRLLMAAGMKAAKIKPTSRAGDPAAPAKSARSKPV